MNEKKRETGAAVVAQGIDREEIAAEIIRAIEAAPVGRRVSLARPSVSVRVAPGGLTRQAKHKQTETKQKSRRRVIPPSERAAKMKKLFILHKFKIYHSDDQTYSWANVYKTRAEAEKGVKRRVRHARIDYAQGDLIS